MMLGLFSIFPMWLFNFFFLERSPKQEVQGKETTGKRDQGEFDNHALLLHQDVLHILLIPPPDMQFVTNFTRMKCQNNILPEKRVNYDKLCFMTKQRKLYFHIINIHTQGNIALNKYILLVVLL